MPRSKKPKQLDQRAVERILDKTAVKLPDKFDATKLCKDLNVALSILRSSGTKAENNKRRKRIADLMDHAAGLEIGLRKNSDDRVFDEAIAKALGRPSGAAGLWNGQHGWNSCDDQFGEAMKYLDWIYRCLETVYVTDNDAPLKTMQEFVWLLSTFYEGNFGQRAGRSRSPDDGKLSGPFIRFVQAIMEEAGISVASASSIETYIKRYRREWPHLVDRSNGDKKPARS
jgi:hypothetical protein